MINLVFGPGAEIGGAALASPDLAGVHFTGSTAVFQSMWRTIGDEHRPYRNYPRIVGETGGKDFILAHPSADAGAVAAAIVRGSFEYQGQKCSASSRLYIPSNLWPELRETLAREISTIAMGDVSDFTNFMGAVIDGSSFRPRRTRSRRRGRPGAEIVAGGGTDDSEGWFVEPTVIKTDDPGFRLLRDELFGPVLTAYVYDEKRWDDTLDLVDETGAVRAHRRGLRDRPLRDRARRTTRCAMRRATSTSTTSRPAPSSASSRSAARAPRARTTRRARCGT